MSPLLLIAVSPVLAFLVFSILFWGREFSFTQSWWLGGILIPLSTGFYFFWKSFQRANIGRGMADVAELPAAIVLTVSFTTVWLVVPLVRLGWSYLSN